MSVPKPATRQRWKRRAEARPDEILAAALDEFIAKGFDAARIEDVEPAHQIVELSEPESFRFTWYMPGTPKTTVAIRLAAPGPGKTHLTATAATLP